MTANQQHTATIVLSLGSHSDPEEGMCLLEAAAWLAGEPFSDSPDGVGFALAALGRSLNDNLFAYHLDQLAPYAGRIQNTRTTSADETSAALLIADWACRTVAPLALDAAGRPDLATTCRQLPTISSQTAASDAAHAVWAAGETAAGVAGQTAWAAGDAAAGAAWLAAWAAGETAAGVAGQTGWAAGETAAGVGWAAGEAARHAAWADREAAGDAARSDLRRSALQLLDRLIALYHHHTQESAQPHDEHQR